MRLIFHDGEKGISNFAKALEEIVAKGPISIATPYLKPKYLLHLVNNKKWRLLTDIGECLGSMSQQERAQFRQLFKDNAGNIKHFDLLHAKVVIGYGIAFLGSANLTESGLSKREEVSVLLTEKSNIKRLQAWFDSLWSRAYKPKMKELSFFSSRLDKHVEKNRPVNTFDSKVKNRQYKMWEIKPSGKQSYRSEAERMTHLVRTVALAPSREWIDDYFELIREAIDITGLTDEDHRISTTCPQTKTVRLNINSRLVLSAYHKDLSAIGFILPRDFTFDSKLERRITKYNPDDPFRPITKNERIDTTPIFVAFKVSRIADLTAYVIESWKKEVAHEVGLRSGSPYKDHHDPLVYKAAIDKGFRKRLIDEAFGGRS